MAHSMGLPEKKVICGIEYKIQEHEGLIVFSEMEGFFGCHTRIAFEHPNGGLWQVSIDATWNKVPVSHIIRMRDLIYEAYGDDFGGWKLKE